MNAHPSKWRTIRRCWYKTLDVGETVASYFYMFSLAVAVCYIGYFTYLALSSHSTVDNVVPITANIADADHILPSSPVTEIEE